jgi:hypothetical protein
MIPGQLGPKKIHWKQYSHKHRKSAWKKLWKCVLMRVWLVCRVHSTNCVQELVSWQKSGGNWQMAWDIETIFRWNDCGPQMWSLEAWGFLRVVLKRNGTVYVGKQMSNIHITVTSYIKIEFLTSQTSVFVPHLHLTLTNPAVLYLRVLVCDLNLQ